MPLAGRVVLQVVETKPTFEEVLRVLTQRGEDSNLDRHLGLRALSDPSQAPGHGAQPRPDVTKF